MKKYVIILSTLFLFSCGNAENEAKKETKNSDKEKLEINEEKQSATNEKVNCEDFLKDYEVWADEVIDLYKKVKQDPSDINNTTKLMNASKKMKEWSEKWQTLYDCSSNEEYNKRIKEIEDKLDNAIKQK